MRNIDSINRPEFPKDTAPLVPPPPIKPQPKNTNISLLRPAKPKGFRWALKVFLSLIVIVILILGSLITWRASNLSDKIFVGTKTSFFQKIREVIRGGGSEKTLIGEN